MALGAIPGIDLRQVGAVLRPALLVGNAECVWVVVTIILVIAVGARQQTQPAQASAWPKARHKREQPTARGAPRVHAATLIGA